MWKKIDDITVTGIALGDTITDDPDNPVDQFEIKSLKSGNITAVHSNGKIKIKVFHETELFRGNWWIKV